MDYTVILVDDDMDDRKFFTDAIESPDVKCVAINHGSRLIETLLAEVRRPDVIFLDLSVPGFSGWKCLTVLKESQDYHEIPVIMYSTSSHTEDISRAKSAGALSYFTKPSDYAVLRECLQTVVTHLRADELHLLARNSVYFN